LIAILITLGCGLRFWSTLSASFKI